MIDPDTIEQPPEEVLPPPTLEPGEIPEDQKLQMLREAMPGGFVAGELDASVPEYMPALPDPVPFDSSTEIVEDTAPELEPFEDDSPSQDTSTESTHPFRLIEVDDTTWRIETEGSSIINDLDSSNMTITDLGIDRTAFGNVYIRAAISTGNPSGTVDVVVDAGTFSEITRSGADQTYAYLLIGEVKQDVSGSGISISQAWNNAAMLTRIFDSADLVWGFIAYPSHPNSLTAGT